MKKINLLLLPLVALSMIGCTGRENTSSVSSSTGETSSTKESTALPSSVISSTSDSSSSISSSSSSSSSSAAPDYYAGWSDKVSAAMQKYLGGSLLPFLNLGKSSEVETEWNVTDSDYGVLSISGTNTWEDTTSSSAANIYTKAGWTILTNSENSFTAKDATGKINVKIQQKSMNVTALDETIVISATYDEDYDKTAATAWDSDITKIFNQNFYSVVPFVYLGTKNPFASYSDVDKIITIAGGKWNADVIEDALLSLSDAGYTVKKDGNEKLTATGKASTGEDAFEIEISKSGASLAKIVMKVSFKEGFDPSVQTAWPSSVSMDLASYLDNHTIPYLYLGTRNVTSMGTQEQNYVEVRGNKDLTKDQIGQVLTNSKAVFLESDGWNTLADESEADSSRYITYEKEFTDKCKVKAIVKESAAYGVVIECYLTEGLVIPSSATAWSTATQTLMTTNFGYVLPYVYLNTTAEVAAYSDSTMTITGGKWISAIMEHVQTTYSGLTDTEGNKVWTVTDATSAIIMEAKIDGNKYKIRVQANSAGNAEMVISFVKKYEVPSTATGWNDDLLTYMDTNLDNHASEIQYVYLRKDSIDDYYYYGKVEEPHLEILGGEFDPEMITEAKKVYTTANGWSILSDSTDSLKVEKFLDDGCQLTVTLNQYSDTDNRALLCVYYEEHFNLEHAPTAWSSATQAKLSKDSDFMALPYIYLGTKNETKPYYANGKAQHNFTNLFYVTGGKWDDRILTNAKTVLESNSYTTYYSKNEYGKCLMAKSIDVSNNTMISIFIGKITASSNVMLYCWKSSLKPITKTGTEDWDSTIKSEVQSYIHSTTYMLPYFSLGTNQSFVDGDDYAMIISPERFTHEKAWLVYDELTAAGYETYITKSGNDLMVNATKTLDDNSKIKLKVNQDSGSQSVCNIYYYPAFKAPEGVTDWEARVKAYMTNTLLHDVPYFYIGADSPTCVATDSGSLRLEGLVWDDLVFDNAIAAFDNDIDALTGKSAWTYMYDYVESDKQLIATKEFSDGCHMTIRIRKETDNNREYAVMEVGCHNENQEAHSHND